MSADPERIPIPAERGRTPVVSLSTVEVGESRTLKLGLLGCGVVGSSVARIVLEDGSQLSDPAGARFELTHVAVLDPTKPRSVTLPFGVITDNARAVVEDPEIDIIVEVIGGIEPPRSLIINALRNGKSVITANKELLAKHGSDLFATAAEHGVDLHFEASVCGAIPIIRTLRESLVGQRIDRVVGILNGTSNFVLSQMDKTGCTLEVALQRAQTLGFAERDPSADIDGHDAAAKAAILSLLVFGVLVTPDQVETAGISHICPEDVEAARLLDRVIKPLAVLERDGDTITAGVFPAVVARSHPLARIEDQFNGVFVDARDAGQLMFYGPGAGGDPTASAIIGDLVSVARNRLAGSRSGSFRAPTSDRFVGGQDRPFPYFLRIQGDDHPSDHAALENALLESQIEFVDRRVARSGRRFMAALVTEEAPLSAIDLLVSSLRAEGLEVALPLRCEPKRDPSYTIDAPISDVRSFIP